LHSAYHRAVYD